MFMTKRFL